MEYLFAIIHSTDGIYIQVHSLNFAKTLVFLHCYHQMFMQFVFITAV